MLLGLTIRDVVLIDRLDLSFRPGLCVLTGETGAGKSILLDALGLALGMRADSALVRTGAEQAVVSAEFAVPPDHSARALIIEAGLATGGDTLVLRRNLGADGRSRAFIDDQPASVGLMRQVGESLIEIEAQFAERGLMDQATHRAALDAFGGYGATLEAVERTWHAWRAIAKERADAEAVLAKARADEDYLRHALAELDTLDPKTGEERSLAEERTLLLNRERIEEAVEAALRELEGERGAERALGQAQRALERLRGKAMGRLDSAGAALDRAALETREAIVALSSEVRALGSGVSGLERIEERLFTLRAAARKYGVAVDDLPERRATFAHAIATLDDGGDRLKTLERHAGEARADYVAAAEKLGQLRRRATRALDSAVMKELPPLHLEKARFVTIIEPLAETDWSAGGADRVRFEVATNPGVPAGPLAKIASGGELSRFMLALKVVLAQSSSVPTLVFDEVDSGIGGAAAAAVGERLHRLGRELQVLVVTHSPQVAARGAHHWRVVKAGGKRGASTRVEALDETARREEIARMLSGASVTAEARAAAASLIAGAAR
ncbi:MAG TPA: DNA repair protein RecN [Stellaceae bacterium]|nr:DNA repair protein RecN [Stellaceae bacterium]